MWVCACVFKRKQENVASDKKRERGYVIKRERERERERGGRERKRRKRERERGDLFSGTHMRVLGAKMHTSSRYVFGQPTLLFTNKHGVMRYLPLSAAPGWGPVPGLRARGYAGASKTHLSLLLASS